MKSLLLLSLLFSANLWASDEIQSELQKAQAHYQQEEAKYDAKLIGKKELNVAKARLIAAIYCAEMEEVKAENLGIIQRAVDAHLAPREELENAKKDLNNKKQLCLASDLLK